MHGDEPPLNGAPTLAKPSPQELSKRRTHSPEFQAKVAMEAISGRKTLQEIAADHAVHPIQVSLQQEGCWTAPTRRAPRVGRPLAGCRVWARAALVVASDSLIDPPALLVSTASRSSQALAAPDWFQRL